jgi:hypothetical protein
MGHIIMASIIVVNFNCIWGSNSQFGFYLYIWIEDIGQGENAVVIGYRKQFVDYSRHPSAPGDIVTAWAVAVPAGVVSFFKMAACVADFPMGAELPTPAMFDIVHHLVLTGMQPI